MRWLDYIFISIAACFLLVSFLIQFPQQHEAFGFPLDDGWIHATYARNLAMRGEFAFNPGETSTGTTSFLWTVLLAGAYKISGTMVFSSLMLGVTGFLFFSFTFYQLSLCVLKSRLHGLIATLLAMFSGFTLWWSLSGMETIVFLAIGLSSLLSYSEEKYYSAAIKISLLTLTRPEGIILGIVFIADQFFRHRKGSRSVKEVSKFGMLSFLGAGIYIVWNLLLTGHVVTTTLAGRRWLAHAPIDIPLNPLFHLKNVGLMIFRWLRIYAFAYIPQNEIFGNVVAGILFSIVLVGILSFIRRRVLSESMILYMFFFIGLILISIMIIPQQSIDTAIANAKSPGNHSIFKTPIEIFESTGTGISGKRLQIISSVIGTMLLSFCAIIFFHNYQNKNYVHSDSSALPRIYKLFLWWLVLHNLMYVIFIPYPGHGGRYQSMNILLLIWLGMIGMQSIQHAIVVGSMRRKLMIAYQIIIVFAVVHVCMYSYSNWRQVYFSNVQHINTIHKQTAQWIDRYLPRDARVAAYDIGALGYFSSRYIIDIGGLIYPDAIHYMATADIDRYMLRSHATHLAMVYVLDEEKEKETIPKWLGVLKTNVFTSTPLYHAQFDSLAWRRNVSLTQNAYPILIVSSLKPKIQE